MKSIESQVKELSAFEDTLVPGAVKAAMSDSGAKSSDLWRVPPSAIQIRPGYNPRIVTPGYEAALMELAQSIADNGFYDSKPLAVSVGDEGGKSVLYLEDGHRRFAAAQIAISKLGASIDKLPVTTLPRSMNAEQRMAHMLHSNQDGVKFTPPELSVFVARFRSMGHDEKATAKYMGITEAYVRQLETLHSSPKAIRDMVESGEISATLAIETVMEHKSEAAPLLQEAKEVAKASGKRVTAKVVKKVAAAKKAGKAPAKLNKTQQEELALKKQRKHGPEFAALLKAVMDKHGKVIDSDFHTQADALFVNCGVI